MQKTICPPVITIVHSLDHLRSIQSPTYQFPSMLDLMNHMQLTVYNLRLTLHNDYLVSTLISPVDGL